MTLHLFCATARQLLPPRRACIIKYCGTRAPRVLGALPAGWTASSLTPDDYRGHCMQRESFRRMAKEYSFSAEVRHFRAIGTASGEVYPDRCKCTVTKCKED
jgi:hypothetical protein